MVVLQTTQYSQLRIQMFYLEDCIYASGPVRYKVWSCAFRLRQAMGFRRCNVQDAIYNMADLCKSIADKC